MKKLKKILPLIFTCLVLMQLAPSTTLANEVAERCVAGDGSCTCLYVSDNPTYSSNATRLVVGGTNPVMIDSGENCAERCRQIGLGSTQKLGGIGITGAGGTITSFISCQVFGGQNENLAQIETKVDSEWNVQTTPSATNQPTEEPRVPREPPRLNVAIPGFGTTFTSNNYIGEYIKAIYQLLIAVSALIAILMFTISGLQYMLAAGNQAAIGQAKKRMGDALIGIILLLSAFAIAQLINPTLTTFESLGITSIGNTDHYDEVASAPRSTEPITLPEGGLVEIKGEHLTVITQSKNLHPTVLEALNAAAKQFNEETGLNVVVTSGSRSVLRQAEEFYDNCLENPGRPCKTITCNPVSHNPNLLSGNSSGFRLGEELQGKSRSEIITILTDQGRATNCPHTSNIAVDAWCERGKRAGHIAEIECQVQLMQAMNENGFCRLTSEGWHFEYNTSPFQAVSSSCISRATASYTVRGKPHSPDTSNCKLWDWNDHVCAVPR